MDQVKIGAFIKSIRKEKGLTQEQLAEQLGVSQKSVSRWETGKTMPDYSLLSNICDALEINVAELLGAERIDGDSVPKKQVTTIAQNMIFLVNDKRRIRRIVGAVLSAVIMLICVVGLYNSEFSISVDSTTELEKAINEYHFADEVKADVLERQAIGNRLYVLYEEREYPGACGLACLEKGILGKYRMISCDDSCYRWINGTKVTVGKTDYCVTYCASDLPIDEYGICGVKGEAGPNLTADDFYLIYKLNYTGSPFLTFTEIEDGVTVSAYDFKYFQNGVEIQGIDELEGILGNHYVEGAPNSGTGTAELGMLYTFEVIIILLGIVFIRYFLTGETKMQAKIKPDAIASDE